MRNKLTFKSSFLYLTAMVFLLAIAHGVEAYGKSSERKGKVYKRGAELLKIRAATKQFRQIENALEAGYISSVDMGAGCSTASAEGHPKQLGAMGIHLVDTNNFGSSDFNFRQPSVLVYVPKRDLPQCTYATGELMTDGLCRNNLSLAAVEEVVFAHLIESGPEQDYWHHIPTFLGKEFYYLHDNPDTHWVDEAHGFPPHYALHIWLFKFNPAGMFSPWNPTVSCFSSQHRQH